MFERSELVCDAGWRSLGLGTRVAGDDCCGRLSLLTFFGEAKKVSGCRAAPGNPSMIEENTASSTTNQTHHKKCHPKKVAFS
jgi:hypothetical protein